MGSVPSSFSSRSAVANYRAVGAAISLLDALYLSIQVPSATVSFVGYGMPRVRVENFLGLCALWLEAHDLCIAGWKSKLCKPYRLDTA